MPAVEHMKSVTARTVARSASGFPRVIISTDMRDSEGDIIEQAGLSFRDPLPVLVGHEYRNLPVGVTTRIIRGERATAAEFRWIEGDPRAGMARNAFEQGALCASIGFRPLAPPLQDPPGYRFTRANVVEFSLVPVPANPGCTPTLLRSLGFKEGTMQTYDIDARTVREALRDVIHNELRRQLRDHDVPYTIRLQNERQAMERRNREADEAERGVRRAVALAFHNPVSYGG